MRLTCTLVFLAAALVNIAAGFTASNFTETGECQGADQVCLYDYTVQQQYFAKDGQNQNSSIVSEVEIMCNSVGEYNGESAVLYCMTIRDIELQGAFFDDEEEEAIRNRHKYLLRSLSGRFCFAQTSDGKIPAIFYAEPQSDSTLNFKKAIAAAFQANFKGTDVEEELDPQSMHRSHYNITSSNEEGTVKMHRSVNEDDVIEYSTGAPKREVKLKKEEDIEYQSGKLQHSSGNTSVRISKDTDKKGDQESFSNLFSVRGSYSLDLKRCSSITKRAYSRHRRNVRDDIEKSGIEENLRAKYNKTVAEIEEMKILRGKLPSVLDALLEFQNDTSAIDVIEKLLELEYQHGPLPGYSPALSDVLEYFTSIQDSTDSSDEQMRVIVYSLLAAERSFQSQMVLFHTLKMATMSEREKNVLINVIGMVKNPHWDFVGLLKEYLNSITKDTQSDELEAEALLLSFGALASGANADVQEFIVSFLFELQNGNQEFEIPVILALGNTGSKVVVDTLLSYLDSPNKNIQIITIQSLRKFTFNQQVLDRLEKVLAEQSDEEVLATVTEVLVTGLEYSSNFDVEHFDAHNELLGEHPILTTLVMATLQTNNTELDVLVQTLLKDVGGEQALSLLTHFHQLSKRGTDWDENNSVYDLVASLSNRQSDVNTYQRHRAYIWGKRFGIDQANLVVAAGLFGGISNDCNNIKVFGRAVAKGNVLRWSTTVIDLQVDLRKTTTTIEGRVYANIAGNFLVDYSRSYPLTSPQCYNYEREFLNERYLIFSYTFPVFVYVGTINFVIQLHGTLSVGFNAEICGQTAQTELLSGNAGFTGAVGASLSGEINVNLLEAVRAGITARANFIYQLEPSVSAQACRSECSVQHQACCGVYDEWPGNTLAIETFYQFRSIKWCDGWIDYPCGFRWGRRRTWDAFSWSWSLGSRERRPLYEQCFGTSNPQCRAVRPVPPCRIGALRLVGGRFPNEGRVEICNQGTWGTVCDDGWSSSDASVVCRQLGYSGNDAQALSRALFGEGSGSIWLDDVGCSGRESTLISCPANPIGNHNCGHHEDAGVRCAGDQGGCTQGDVKLLGGIDLLEGRVEVCNRGEWGTVCDDLWDSDDASVVCTQLGFSGSNAQAFGVARFSQGSGSIWLDNVGCTGRESTLISCPANPIGDHNCGHYEDAGVRCAGVCTYGDVRLVGGTDLHEGRVEVCNGGEWGTVCDDGWDSNDASVVCKQLGFSGSNAQAFGVAHFSQGSGSIWLDDVGCTGRESTLMNCQANPIGNHNCRHHEDAGVRCRACVAPHSQCSYGDVRLVGGTDLLEGRVEVCNRGQWGTVCDDGWDSDDANVVCRQLGFSDSNARAFGVAHFSQGSGSIWLDDVGCTGRESTLISCLANPIGDHNCRHYEDAGVRCAVHDEGGCTQGDVRLVGGTDLREGRVEVCNRGEWGTVCDDGWDSNDANVVCRQLGFSGSNAQAFGVAHFSQGSGSIWLDDVGCTGRESTLISCQANQIGNHNCRHHEDAGVRCAACVAPQSQCTHGDVRLVGGRNLLEGRVEVCNRGEWGTVCDDRWDSNDARVVCKQLGFSGEEAVGSAEFGAGSGPIWLDDVKCIGSEINILMNCPANPIGDHNCGHYEDAGVRC